MNVAERIIKILDDTGLSARAFEISIGKTSGYLNTLVKRNSSPSVEVIQKIVETYPDYSLRWIITGMGSIKERNINILNEDDGRYEVAKTETLDSVVDRVIQNKLDEMKKELTEEIMGAIFDKIEPHAKSEDSNDN